VCDPARSQAKHTTGDCSTWGIDGNKGEIADMTKLGIWEPYLVKVQTIKTAIEVGCASLIVWKTYRPLQLLLLSPAFACSYVIVMERARGGTDNTHTDTRLLLTATAATDGHDAAAH